MGLGGSTAAAPEASAEDVEAGRSAAQPSAAPAPAPHAVAAPSPAAAASPGAEGSGDAGAGAEEPPPLVLVLLGRVGAGKSSTANSLVGAQGLFEARRSAAAVTAACHAEEAPRLGGRRVLVLDTPGFGDAAQAPAEVYAEIRRGVAELAPEGAVVSPLFVFSLQGRVGEDDFAVVQGCEEHVFGADSLKAAVVVWTHADALDGGLEEYLVDAGDRLRELLGRCGGSLAIDNRQRGPSPQVEAIVRRAESVAFACRLVRQREPRTYGRRTARRQRQLEAGLLRPKVVSETGSGCAVT